jgi:alpha-L-fucosidase 2
MTAKLKTTSLLFALVCAATPLLAAERTAVKVDIDWGQFLGRHDIVWEKLPERFDHGVWHGNGLLGAVVHRENKKRMRWELGRSDVTAHRRDNNRLPIGGMVLETVGEITNGTARLELWDAESSGTIETTKGSIQFRTFIHATDLLIVVEIACSEGEQDAAFKWMAARCFDRVNNTRFKFGDPPNPESRVEVAGNVQVCVQPRYAGGEFATAWREVTEKNGTRRLTISIADTYPEKEAKAQAVAAVRNACATDLNELRTSHRAWWHAYYPKSFVTVPDGKIEGFYWIQIHKLACATRRDRPVMDLLGPWFRDTGWPRIWWNLNIQTAYLSVYTANHLEIGESLTRMMDRNRKNFVRNAKELWKVDDCATVPHTTCYEGLRGDGSRAPDKYINPGDFTWALHNYYLQYRYSMDHNMVTDHEKHAFYPLLRGSVNLYLHLLEEGDDGKLHLPGMHSPEYGHDSDNNYNLSLLRWGCQTLLALDARYKLNDPLAPRWREVLDKLVPYPTDEHGLRVGAGLAATKSHRHWSHMLMMHPLRIMNCEQPGNRELMRKSVDFWMQVGGGRGLKAWSHAAAASLYAGMGDGDKALESLHKHHDERRFVMPNGMYIEGAPVIECALVAGRSLHDMLLQSWGGKIRVFPAVPSAWEECAFHDLRTEGAFLVSAVRSDGATQWIRVKSLAGEPCRVVHGMGPVPRTVTRDGKAVPVKDLGNGVVEIPLSKGGEVLLRRGPRDVAVRPLDLKPDARNYWGLKDRPAPPKPIRKKLTPPALSSGKPAKASGEWSKGYAAAKAFDDDLGSRWGCTPNSRSGWLEVDLGKPQVVGRVVIVESEFPRTEQFTVEYRDGDKWRVLVAGKQLGGTKTIDFKPVTAQHIRLNIIKANEVPTLEEFRVLAPADQ